MGLEHVAAIVRKELIQIRRDPRTLAMVLALPVLQLVLFAYAINTVVDHLPTVVLDQSRSAESRAFVAAFQNSGYFDVLEQAASPAAAAAIDAGRAKVAPTVRDLAPIEPSLEDVFISLIERRG